ncbi:MAG: TetR/AcrR family transcriptional regulator C-terminal domain-containing protein [Oscillospiraceae bacterium]|jgi:AcrR family transcriptional regulator|nr:TetR/AcrR family transcriptional regulator C-terminal domain-containing protein [Oscillospiraceae bacterium]
MFFFNTGKKATEKEEIVDLNKRIEKTKQELIKALYNLLAEKSIKNITVSELCKKAKINRTTFYKYYSIPVDILRELADDVLKRTRDIVMTIYDDPIRGIKVSMLKYCQMLYENREIMKVYMLYAYDFMEINRSLFITDNVKKNMMRRFFQGGVSAITVHWILEDCPQSPEEIAQILSDYLIRIEGWDYTANRINGIIY